MKKGILLLLAVVVCLPVGAAKSTQQERKQLKIISLNVRYYNDTQDTGVLHWNVRRTAVVNMVRQEQPDLLGLQEARRPQIDDLAQQLPQYGHQEFGRETGDPNEPSGGEHMVILYNLKRFKLLDNGHFWLSETPDRLSRGWDAVCRRVAVWVLLKDRQTGKKFYYFNTHFDHVGKSARLHEAQMMTQQIHKIAGDEAIVFLSGDLNEEREGGSPMLEHLDTYMQCVRETAPVTDHKKTYNDFGGRATELIDYIYYRHARPVLYRTLDGNYGEPYISDHYPILGVFELK